MEPPCVSGRFKEKASILHKMAKQRCKDEASNGVGESRCGGKVAMRSSRCVSKLTE